MHLNITSQIYNFRIIERYFLCYTAQKMCQEYVAKTTKIIYRRYIFADLRQCLPWLIDIYFLKMIDVTEQRNMGVK